MAALPYMQFYVADYLADTTHLNAAQHGAYLLLLFNYWQRGRALPNSPSRLAAIARMTEQEFNSCCDLLSEFFTVTETEWVHERVERDLEAVRGVPEAKSRAGKASAAARATKRQQDSNTRSNTASTGVQQEANDTDTEQIQNRTEKKDQNHPVRAKRERQGKTTDTRHSDFREDIDRYWHHSNREEHAPWDGSEAKELARLLSAYPTLTREKFRELLSNRAKSGVNHGDRPREWLGGITRYTAAPVDRFNRPVPQGATA